MNEFVHIQTAKFILVVVMKVMKVYRDGVDKVDQLLTHNVCHIACHHINCATGIRISEISFMNLVRPREFIVNRTE